MSGPVDFTAQYRAIFDRFGYPLTERHGIDETTLDRAAVRLDCKIPEALRAYYVVAGNEKRFNQALQRILPPSGWSVAGKHLAFVEENQAVCQWGVSLRSKGAGDPVISQGFEEETDEGESSFAWHSEHARCSKFITVLLHYQAVSGGLRHCGGGDAPDDVHNQLKRGWTFAGEVSGLWAFSRPNQVVCVMEGMSPTSDMTLLAGGKTARDLAEIGKSLGVTFG